MTDALDLATPDPARPAATLSVIVPSYNERPNVAPMIARLDQALRGVAWEAIFVDDDSPDGTGAEIRRAAANDPRIRCIRRIGRRGLASAVIEGALSSSADYVAVIDGDLQHDETRLPVMLHALETGTHDIAVASRHVDGGGNAGLANRWRHVLSDGGIRLAQWFLPTHLSDPMSGFFMLPRPLFEELAHGLTGQGFKILLDLVLSAPAPLRVVEIPAEFRARTAGESKLDALVLMQFAGLLLDKVFGGLLPLRFVSFALVGGIGVFVHLTVLIALRKTTGLAFETEQAMATVVAMVFNFELNNVVTYRDQRLRGPRLWRGLLLFMLVCGFGAVANIGIAKSLYDTNIQWTIAGAIGAVIGVVWNYAVSATLVSARALTVLGKHHEVAVALAWLAALTLLRLVVAGVAPLAPDEAYYWVFSRVLAPGYLDHPPMVALWIRAGTLLAGDTALGVRLLGPLSVALGSVLLADAGERLLPGRRAGITAAVLLNATLLLGAGSVLMTPDTPLLFWVACLWALARLLASGRAAWWLVVGGFAGLALASKYTAALLWVGIGLWLCWVPSLRRWWTSGALWAGALLGGLVFLPVVLWNARHGWVSFVRQGGRVGDWHPARAAQFLSELAGGQIGLATPLLAVLFAAGVVLAARLAWRERDPAWSLLAALTLPGVAVFAQHALGDRVQGNWPAILYPGAALAAAGLAGNAWQRLHRPAVVLGLAITALVYVQATTFMLPLPPGLDPIARQLGGWDKLADAVATARRTTGASFVAADQYGVAAELARALPAGIAVVGVDSRWTFTDLPRVKLAGRTGILVRRARDGGVADHAVWADATPIGEVAHHYRLWRVTAGDITAARLP